MATNRDVWNPGALAKEITVATNPDVWNPGAPAQGSALVTNRGVWNPASPAKETAVATNREVWNPWAPAQGSAVVTNRDVWNPGAPAKENAVATNRDVWNPVALPQELQWLHIVAPGILGPLRRLTWGGWAVGRVSVFPSYSLRPPSRPAGRAQPRRPLSPHISRPPQSAFSMEPTRCMRRRFKHIQ